jgi:hypothetical protein
VLLPRLLSSLPLMLLLLLPRLLSSLPLMLLLLLLLPLWLLPLAAVVSMRARQQALTTASTQCMLRGSITRASASRVPTSCGVGTTP